MKFWPFETLKVEIAARPERILEVLETKFSEKHDRQRPSQGRKPFVRHGPLSETEFELVGNQYLNAGFPFLKGRMRRKGFGTLLTLDLEINRGSLLIIALGIVLTFFLEFAIAFELDDAFGLVRGSAYFMLFLVGWLLLSVVRFWIGVRFVKRIFEELKRELEENGRF